jgi:hypothetical protein
LHLVGTSFPSVYTDKCPRNFPLSFATNLKSLATKGIADNSNPHWNYLKQQLAKLVTWYMYDHVTTRLISFTLGFKLFVITVLFLTDTSFSLSANNYKKIIRAIQQKCLKYLTFRNTVFDGELWVVPYKKRSKVQFLSKTEKRKFVNRAI